MTQQLPAHFSEPRAGELQDLIPRLGLFADENAVAYEALRDTLMDHLAPVSPYEQAFANQLFELEWEMYRHRRMRDTVIKMRTRDLLIGVLATGKIRTVDKCDEEHRDLAIALVNGDPERTPEAIVALESHKVTVGEVVAEAFSQVAHRIEPHEKALASRETRRRRLHEDYQRLKAARAKPIEDAEIVE